MYQKTLFHETWCPWQRISRQSAAGCRGLVAPGLSFRASTAKENVCCKKISAFHECPVALGYKMLRVWRRNSRSFRAANAENYAAKLSACSLGCLSVWGTVFCGYYANGIAETTSGVRKFHHFLSSFSSLSLPVFAMPLHLGSGMPMAVTPIAQASVRNWCLGWYFWK